MLDEQHRAAPRRAATAHAPAPSAHASGRAHPAAPRPRRRRPPPARAALARTRLLEIEHDAARSRLASPPLEVGEEPIRLLLLAPAKLPLLSPPRRVPTAAPAGDSAPASAPPVARQPAALPPGVRTEPLEAHRFIVPAPVVEPLDRPVTAPVLEPPPRLPVPAAEPWAAVAPAEVAPLRAPALAVSARRQAIAARRVRTRSRRRVVAMVVLLAAFVALPSLSFSGEHRVTVTLEGDRYVRTTRAGTVGEFLVEQGIDLRPHDVVTPAAGESIDGALDLRVLRGREVLVDVNGTTRLVWTTERSVDGILAQLGLSGADVAGATDGELATGSTVSVSKTWRLDLTHDGTTVEMATTAATVGEALAHAGITVDADDEVTPGVGTPLSGAVSDVTVVRVATFAVSLDMAIEAPVEVRSDPDLMRGGARVGDSGRPGVRRETYDVTTRDGVETTRVLVDSGILLAPKAKVVSVGTKAPRDDTQATGRVRFAPAGWQATYSDAGRATWYQYKSGTCAHNTLPRGTLVRVTNLDNGRATFCVVSDRGIRDPANLIDLAHDVFDDLAPRSQGVVRARIEW